VPLITALICSLSYEGGHVFDEMPRRGCIALLREWVKSLKGNLAIQ
jgi:hypothetical protein